MLKNIKLGTRLGAGFASIILILLMMTALAILKMQELSGLTNSLYKHPFAVSTSILQVKESITSMHRLMKDIALANSAEQINKSIIKITEVEKATLKHFALLEDRFLGDKSKIKALKEKFINWKPIRDDVISLISQDERTKAAKIINGKGATYTHDLHNSLVFLEKITFDKASEFTNNANAQGQAAIVQLLILVSIGIILAILLGWRITLSVLRPLGGEPKYIEALTRKIAEGDLSVEFLNSGTETGIYSAMRLMVEKLREMMKQISESAISQASASEELASISTQTQNNISDQSHATEQVATAMNQMHSTAEDVAKNTNIAADAAEAARALVDQGTSKAEQSSTGVQGLADDLDKTSTIITELAESAEDITDILAVIKSIADQTNLLALNAAIEAARAGESGRGFAVVADEVRTLAYNTQKSTAEIEDKISKVQEGAKASVESMSIGRQQADVIVTQTIDVQQALAEIKNAVYKIIDMNLQIASAAEEQSSVSADVGKQIVEIKELSDHTGIGAVQISTATEELAQFAAQLNAHVTRFKM